MEKSIRVTRSEVIKWGTILVMILSSFLAMQYKTRENERRIEQMEIEMKELKRCQEETARLVANINGKQDIIINYVETINKALTNSSINPAR